LLYSVIRVAIFAAVLTLLLLAQTPGWIAAFVAAIFGFAASYIFFGNLRRQVAQDLEDRRTGKTHAPTDDEDAEDELENQTYLNGGGLEGDGPGKK
jgi:dipeptide/tripeptide permease